MKQTTQFKSGKILNNFHKSFKFEFVFHSSSSSSCLVYAVLFHVFILSFEKIEKKKQYEHSIYYKYISKPRSNTNRLKLEIYYFLLLLFSLEKKTEKTNDFDHQLNRCNKLKPN